MRAGIRRLGGQRFGSKIAAQQEAHVDLNTEEEVRNPSEQPSSAELARFAAVAEEGARAAGDVLMARRGRVAIELKAGHADLVTEADRAAERAVFDLLRENFPDHGFIGEESGSRDGDSPYRWIVDPLDGTTNYAQGLPLFAVSIGLEREGRLVAGVIYAPALEGMYTAYSGGGAFFNGEPMRVSSEERLENSLLVTGFVHDDDVIRNNVVPLGDFIGRSRGVRLLGAAAINLAFVAQGLFEAYWAPSNQAWDVAAGTLIVEEAGGRVTDMAGGPLDLFRPRLLATNGLLHDTMVSGLAGEPLP